MLGPPIQVRDTAPGATTPRGQLVAAARTSGAAPRTPFAPAAQRPLDRPPPPPPIAHARCRAPIARAPRDVLIMGAGASPEGPGQAKDGVRVSLFCRARAAAG